MFGGRWFGRRWFGGRWWGDGPEIADTITDEAFTAWLSTPNRRCVLAEFSAVGYDSDGSPASTKTVNAYIANMGFTSHATDTPPSQHYNAWIKKLPTFRREMGVALSGRATNGFGSLVVANPADALSGPGVRDDWLRMKWKRNYLTLYLGDPSWRKADFRKILVGTLGQPSAPNVGEIEFPIADLGDLFNGLLQTNKFASGSYKPLAVGMPSWCDLPSLDPSALTYQMNDGAMALRDETNSLEQLYDNGVLIPDILRSDAIADPATDTLYYSGSPTPGHGYSDGYVMYIVAGSPTGLFTATEYYLVNTTSTTWQVSLTLGGSPIDFSSVQGSPFYISVYPYRVDRSTGVATLLTTPASPRISAYLIAQGDGSADLSDAKLHNILSYVIFDKGGVSTAFKDTASFAALGAALGDHAAGIWLNGQSQTTIGEALDRITRGSNTWYGVTPDGFIQVGLLSLPEATSVMDFTDSNTRDLALTSVIRPIDFSESDVTYFQPNLDSVLWVQNSDGGYQVNKTFLASYVYGAGTTPLDDHPELSDSRNPRTFDLIYTEGSGAGVERARLVELYKRTLGIFTFRAKLSAITLAIGQTISLTHPRLGWKMYEGPYDPTSPDDTRDFDATKAVVIGTDVNLSANDAFPVKITVFRQIPGYYPEGDLN